VWTSRTSAGDRVARQRSGDNKLSF
jgi:hypothetical protein